MAAKAGRGEDSVSKWQRIKLIGSIGVRSIRCLPPDKYRLIYARHICRKHEKGDGVAMFIDVERLPTGEAEPEREVSIHLGISAKYWHVKANPGKGSRPRIDIYLSKEEAEKLKGMLEEANKGI